MRTLFLLLCFFILISCHSNENVIPAKPNQTLLENLALESDLDVMGSILIYDLNNQNYYSNDFNWANKGQLPASTFKIPNSLIALELGIVDNENTIFEWDGKPRNFEIWEQDLSFKKAFHYSCVPCYQEIARKINPVRMNAHIDNFHYGHLDINKENIDNFWLTGNSKITQFEQIKFLKNLYQSQLRISDRTDKLFKQMFIAKQTDDYVLSAKTGMTFGSNGEGYNGWYVGYIETKDNVYFFATNISPKSKYNKLFNNKRKSYTIDALKQMEIINE